ncbi:MAG: hypothetical protein DRP09_13575 [Candidatus Thorarchaeota archaeon]|nr:MAG: hypothetical protein DRP09_13575 [Candidatus Thorarchaeota archaeon]
MPLKTLLKLKKLSALQKKQLLDDHRICHAWWSMLKKGRRMKLKSGEEVTKELVTKRHTLIVEKLFEIGFCHHMRDSLDSTLPKRLIKESLECSRR